MSTSPEPDALARRVDGLTTQVRTIKQAGLYGTIAAAVILGVVAAFVWRAQPDPTPAPPADRYQLSQGEKGQMVRLDRMTGAVEVIENGVLVSDLAPKS